MTGEPEVIWTADGDDADDAYAAGDIDLADLTDADLARLEQLPEQMATVTDRDSALEFYDRLAGHG